MLVVACFISMPVVSEAGPIKVFFSTDAYSVTEDAGQAVITVWLTKSTSKTVSVDYSTTSGTATPSVDFTPTSGTLIFDSGYTSASFTVSIVDDATTETDETVLLNLSNPSNAQLGLSSAVLTIVDNDSTPQPTANITEPTDGFTFNAGANVSMNGTSSTVPDGHNVWFAALIEGSGDPLTAVHIGSTLSESFTTSTDQSYIIRLVIANASAMPPDSQLRGLTLPCIDGLECDSNEVTIYQTPPQDAVITAPTDGAAFDPNDTVIMDATNSIQPVGYDIWFGALQEGSGNPMILEHSGSTLSESFTAGDVDGYIIRLVVATPAGMPADADLRGSNLPCLNTFECDSAEVTIHPTAPVAPEPPYYLEAAPLSATVAKLTWVDNDRKGSTFEVYRGTTSGSLNLLTILRKDQISFVDIELVAGTTYYYQVVNTKGASVEVACTQPASEDTTLSLLPTFATEWTGDFVDYHDSKATVTLTLVSEDPTWDPTGSTIELFIDEPTFEDITREPWIDAGYSSPPSEFETEIGYGRDDVSYVDRSTIPDYTLVVTDPAAIVFTVPNVSLGQHSFRYVVTDQGGTDRERAILWQVLNPDGYYGGPSFVGAGKTSRSKRPLIFGYGPPSRPSPDGFDKDHRYYAQLSFKRYTADTCTNPPTRYYVFTDENGYWEFQPPVDINTYQETGDYIVGCLGHWGQFNDGSPTPTGRTFPTFGSGTLDLNQTSFGQAGTTSWSYYESFSLDVVGGGGNPAPQLDPSTVPSTVIAASTEPVADYRLRFRVTDELGDINLRYDPDSDGEYEPVRITNQSNNNSIHDAWMSPNQDGVTHAEDNGYWDADIPLVQGDNVLCVEAQDFNGSFIAQPNCVTISRVVPEVVASINSPGPSTWKSYASIHLDATTSEGPPDMESRWVFFYTHGSLARPELEASSLETDVEMPPIYRGLIARLVVATAGNLPPNLYSTQLPCTLEGSSGQCDSVEIQLNNSCCTSTGCKGEGQSIQVDILEPAADSYLPYNQPVTLSAQGSGIPGATYAYRWTIADIDTPDDRTLLNPVGADSTGFDPANQLITLDPVAEGLGLGTYVIFVEAGFVDTFNPGSCAGSAVEQYAVVTFSHELSAVAPGQLLTGESLRVYGSTFLEGQSIEVSIDDDAIDPPLYGFQAFVSAGKYVDIILDGLAAGTYFVAVAEPGGAGQSIWKQALMIEAPAATITNEEDESCGGPGTECSHSIVPGQTLTGSFNEAGDTDNFYFSAAPGTTFDIVLERVDTTLSPFHPDSVDPELMIADPDGMVGSVTGFANDISADNTDARISGYITPKTGVYLIVCRTSKGYGDYTLTLNRTGTPAGSDFTVAPYGARAVNVVKAVGEPSEATLSAIVLDPRGLPTGGATLDWAVQEGALADSEVYISHSSGIAQGDFTLDASGSASVVAGFSWPAMKNMVLPEKAKIVIPSPGAIAGYVQHNEDHAVSTVHLPGAARFKELREASLRATTGNEQSQPAAEAKLFASCPEIDLKQQKLSELTLPAGAVSIESLSLEITEPGGAPITGPITGVAASERKDLNAHLVATCVDAQGGAFECAIDGAEIFLEVVDSKREYTRGIVTGSGVCRNTLITASGEDNAFTFEAGTRAVFSGIAADESLRFATTELVVGATRVKVKNDEDVWLTPSANTFVDVAPEPGEPKSIHWFQPKDFVSPKKLEHALLLTDGDNGMGAFFAEGAVFGLLDEFKNVVVGWGKDDSEHHMAPGVDQVSVEPISGGTGTWGEAPWQTIYYNFSGFPDRYRVRNFITDDGAYLGYDDADFYWGFTSYRVCVQTSTGSFCDVGSIDNSSADWALFMKVPAWGAYGYEYSYVSPEDLGNEASWHTSPGQPLRFQPSGKPFLMRVEPIMSTEEYVQPHDQVISPDNPVTTRIWVSGPTDSPRSVRQTREGPDDPFIYPEVEDVEICTGSLTMNQSFVQGPDYCDQEECFDEVVPDPDCVPQVGEECPQITITTCNCLHWTTPPPTPHYDVAGECNTAFQR